MTPSENRRQFATKHGIPFSNDDGCANAEHCEALIGYAASKLQNPSAENIQRILYVADVIRFIQTLYAEYQETYTAGKDGIQGTTANILLQPGYETVFYKVKGDGTVEVKRAPQTEEVGANNMDQHNKLIQMLETQGPKVFDNARRNEGWKAARPGEKMRFAQMIRGWEPYVETLERIRIYDAEWLLKEEMPQELLDKHPEWEWPERPEKPLTGLDKPSQRL